MKGSLRGMKGNNWSLEGEGEIACKMEKKFEKGL